MHLRRSALVALVFLMAPMPTHAHEQQVFEIDGALYKFIIGSLNEPVYVDDKTGVDLRVAKIPSHTMSDGSVMMGMMHGATGTETPIEGLEETLKVEIKANGSAKTMDISTVYGTPGAYKAPYYPTRAMEVQYRVFGELNGKPIDVTFTCSSAGHKMGAMEANTERINVGNGVTRVSQMGAFGCPKDRSEVNFPDTVPTAKDSGQSSRKASLLGGTGLLLGASALGIAINNRRKLQVKDNKLV